MTVDLSGTELVCKITWAENQVGQIFEYLKIKMCEIFMAFLK